MSCDELALLAFLFTMCVLHPFPVAEEQPTTAVAAIPRLHTYIRTIVFSLFLSSTKAPFFISFLICRHSLSTGMHYIEGGWPGSNPKDVEFFERARTELPSEAWAKVVAFGRCARCPAVPIAAFGSFLLSALLYGSCTHTRIFILWNIPLNVSFQSGFCSLLLVCCSQQGSIGKSKVWFGRQKVSGFG